MIRGCLDLRERYVYRENVAPWMKAPVEGSSASGVNSDPLCFVPVEATAVSWPLLPIFRFLCSLCKNQCGESVLLTLTPCV